MVTFLVGIALLLVGGFFYGKYCEKVFGPDDRETPAITERDGVDYVPMKKWKNSLIELLNIAGTGPILGPIQGILFGPIAFILIPIGCVFGGALHDYMCGMISIREKGAQMPALVNKFLGKKVYGIYQIFLCLLMLLVGTVFIYTPGDLVVSQLLGQKPVMGNPVVWIVYGLIFLYYLCATLFPIDKIIGRIYPIFGAILLLSAVGVGVGIFTSGYQLAELTSANWLGIHPDGIPLVPTFFVTIACGIVSGFHSTQATLIARSVSREREGRGTFYNTMILEGLIAMIWAAAAMGVYAKGIDSSFIGTASVIGIVARDLLGSVGGVIAIIGVIVLPITSGDTALRSLRLILAEHFNFDQKIKKNRVALTIGIFIPVIAILLFAKSSEKGFNILWRYFSWSNQTIAVFAFAMITVYLIVKNKNYFMSLIPGMFYAYVIFSYILNAQIGFNLSINISYIISAPLTLLYAYLTVKCGKNLKENSQEITGSKNY
ncbi:carbon starvation CstA family protein [Metaclostridioides mangenotii]|uniref:Carbon starvation protein CstA n=1 Tax=Metaclostridioides mangenotii TaxID=1540 RepID=A0ABS4E743_9FIRM|nr:carbon starvation protein A [Clostridioides mangenotii]MBP1853755.1 carbon starvation protein CstA [Clostridioides mangenotii]